MRDVLVVQWSRLGDVIQSRPLLRSLKNDGPTRILFSCDARYISIARQLPEVDEVLPVNIEQLVQAARSASLAQALNEIVRQTDFGGYCHENDLAIVLSRSGAAALFAERLGFRHILGYKTVRSGLIVPGDIRWLEQVWSDAPPHIHLGDLWIRMAGLPPNQHWLPSIVAADSTARSPMLGILCESGDPVRTPPWNWLQGLLRMLIECSERHVALMGLSNSMMLNVDAQFATKVIDLRGKTQLDMLEHSLAACDLIIGPDTGALHLAGALGIPTLGLFAAGASPHTTGVYAPNALSIVVQNSWSEELAGQVTNLAASLLDGRAISVSTRLPTLRSMIGARGVQQVLLESTCDSEQNTLNDHRNPEDVTTAAPPLTIIIPERGQYHLTDALLEQLNCWVPDAPLEIIVVSSDLQETRYFGQSQHPITLIDSPAPLSFAAACNRGAASSSSPWLLFLNNDIKVTGLALDALWCARQRAALVAPIALYPDCIIQNAGVKLLGSAAEEIAHGSEQADFEEPDALSAIALLMERSSFVALGGFDTAYQNGYEDLDLSLRAKQAGMSLRICAEAKIVHLRSSTPGRFEHDIANRNLFESRWISQFQQCRPPTSNCLINAQPPVVVISEQAEQSAGAVLRWTSLLEECGLARNLDYAWLQCDAHSSLSTALQSILARAKQVIVFRPLQNTELVQQLMQLDSSQQLITDTDDLIFDRFAPGSHRGRQMRTFEVSYQALAARADLNIAATQPIVSSLAQHGIHAECWPTVPAPDLLATSVEASLDHPDIRIGFVGHPAHNIDLGLILPLLELWLEADERISFYWWGSRPGNLVHHPRVIQGGPIIDNYRLHLRRLQRMRLALALAPLLNSPTNMARSPVKYFDWCTLGVPAIYSAVEPYHSTVKHNKTGILVTDELGQWHSAMGQLINDVAFRKRMAGDCAVELHANQTRRLAITRMRTLLQRQPDYVVKQSDICRVTQ